MSFSERLKLMDLRDIYPFADESVSAFRIVNLLDTICSHPKIVWSGANLLNQFKKHCKEATEELTVHSMTIAVAFTRGKLINVGPITEAGYQMQYVLDNGRLASILWITPKGRIRLEYRNDHTRRPK